MKRITGFFMAAVLILSLAVCDRALAADAVDASITFMTQEYIGDNIAEIPYITYEGEKNEEIDAINRSLNQGIQQIYDEFMDAESDRNWIEIRSYPFTTDRYLQVVVTSIIYPTYGTAGDLLSINFDMEENVWISTEDALEAEGIDYDDVKTAVETLYHPEFEGLSVGDMKISGFLLHELDGSFLGRDDFYVEFLLEVTIENTESEPWKYFFSYTPLDDSLIELLSHCLFDPFSMDETDPPLYYARYMDDQQMGPEDSGTEVGMYLNHYEDGNFVEIMLIQYDGPEDVLEEYDGRNPEIEYINNLIEAGPWQMWNDFSEGNLDPDPEAEFIEIRSYSFVDDEYIQIVTTCFMFPETHPELYTKLWSYNYSRSENMLVELDDVLETLDLTQEDVAEAFVEWLEGSEFVSAEAVGFIFDAAAVNLLVEVILEYPEGTYKDFFLYTPDTGEFLWLDPFQMFYTYDDFEILPWNLAFDMEGFEQIGPYEYWYDDGSLFVQLDNLEPQTDLAYDEDQVEARIKELEGDDIQDIEISFSEEYSQLLSFPAWIIKYTWGGNEDTTYCIDLLFQTDLAEYRVHTGVDADSDEDYEDIILNLFDNIYLTYPIQNYLDTEAMMELVFPSDFSSDYERHESGAVIFPSLYDGTKLIYCVMPNSDAQDELFAFCSLAKDPWFERDGGIYDWGYYEDEETGETVYGAYLWVGDTEAYFMSDELEVFPVVAVVCETEEQAMYWLDRLIDNDIYIARMYYLDMGYDLEYELGEEEALTLLADALYYRLEEGLILVSTGLGDMNGVPCWEFSLGEDSPEKFTALEHFVVTFDGEIFIYDITTNEYEPFAFG